MKKGKKRRRGEVKKKGGGKNALVWVVNKVKSNLLLQRKNTYFLISVNKHFVRSNRVVSPVSD